MFIGIHLRLKHKQKKSKVENRMSWRNEIFHKFYSPNTIICLYIFCTRNWFSLFSCQCIKSSFTAPHFPLFLFFNFYFSFCVHSWKYCTADVIVRENEHQMSERNEKKRFLLQLNFLALLTVKISQLCIHEWKENGKGNVYEDKSWGVWKISWIKVIVFFFIWKKAKI